MQIGNHINGFDGYVLGRVRYHAKRLSRSLGFDPVDVADIEQDLALDLHRRLPRFDPAKSALPTFVSHIVKNCAETRREQVLAEKRGIRITRCSLHDIVPSEDGGETFPLIDTIDTSHGLWWDGGMTWDAHTDMRIDVSRVISRLPEPLAELARRLANETVLEISRRTGQSRGSIYDAIRKLRKAFIEAGLEIYLAAPSDRFNGDPVDRQKDEFAQVAAPGFQPSLDNLEKMMSRTHP